MQKLNGTLMGVVPSGSRFDFYVTDSSVLAVVVAEELVDGVGVKLIVGRELVFVYSCPISVEKFIVHK